MTDSFFSHNENPIPGMPDHDQLWAGSPVELMQMLDAREQRAFRQMDLISRFGKPLLCFTMNIAGPLKNNELIRRGFEIGVDAFRQQLKRVKARILYELVLEDAAGNEAYFSVDMEALELKRLTCELEDRNELGRLFDMDILVPLAGERNPDSLNGSDRADPVNAGRDREAAYSAAVFRKLDRREIGGSPRPCLICGAPGKGCSSRRLHTVAELQQKTAGILYRSVLEYEASFIAEYAVRSLLYEVAVTPKPGLVDRCNSGSHRDMDFYTFLNSSASLWPYFRECAQIGQRSAFSPAEETFHLLRTSGRLAEDRMLRATDGVNTHKGAIFTLGIAAAAAGRLSARSLLCADSASSDLLRKNPSSILEECRSMTGGLIESDFAGVTKENAVTIGQKLFAEYGITGVRGQMEAGLPAVSAYGLPLLKKLLSDGCSPDEAGATVLMALIAHTEDTSLIHRSSVAVQKAVSAEAGRILSEAESNSVQAVDSPDTEEGRSEKTGRSTEKTGHGTEKTGHGSEKTGRGCISSACLEELDRQYIGKNLSPGGCADLLAVCWFLYTMEQEAL